MRICAKYIFLGPSNPKLSESQWSWINSTLKASTADFLIVAGHYPVWSIAEHGSTPDLVQKLQPMLQSNKVTAYMCGHGMFYVFYLYIIIFIFVVCIDHTFEYIDTGDGVGYVDTGGTHVCDSSTEHSNTIPKNSLKFHGCDDGGFTRIKIDSTGMTVTYYYGKSTNPQYSVSYKPRT